MCFLPLIKMSFHQLLLKTLDDNEHEKKKQTVGNGRRKPACQLVMERTYIGFQW